MDMDTLIDTLGRHGLDTSDYVLSEFGSDSEKVWRSL